MFPRTKTILLACFVLASVGPGGSGFQGQPRASVPVLQDEPIPYPYAISFQQLVNCADLIAIGRVTSVESEPGKIGALARARLDLVLKGQPLGNTGWVEFGLEDPHDKRSGMFVPGGRYVLFLAEKNENLWRPDSTFPLYKVVDTVVMGDFGRAEIRANHVFGRAFPEGNSGPMPLASYVGTIRAALQEGPADLPQRVQRLVAGLRKGYFVWSDDAQFYLGKGEFDVILTMEDIRDLLHDRAIPLMAPYLSNKDPRIRLGIYSVLKRMGNRVAVPFLLKGLRDPDREVRLLCVLGLNRAMAWNAVPALAAVFDENVLDEQADQLNQSIDKAMRNITVLNLYLRKRWKEPIEEFWNRTIKIENIPHYSSSYPYRGPVEVRREAIRQWREWVASRKSWFSP